MELTKYEREMLEGQHGAALRKCMGMLVAIGDVYEAERMVPVNRIHISGANHHAMGPALLKLVEEMAASPLAESAPRTGCRFRTFATTNPAAVDLGCVCGLGIADEEVAEQRRATGALERMGAYSTHTCVPYLVGNVPRFGEHVASGESSVIIFYSSVIGARTSREGGITAIAAGLTGRTSLYGLHLDANRRGQVLVRVNVPLNDVTDYGTLGYFVGDVVQGDIPVFEGIPSSVTVDELKMLGAALASSGAVAMYHVVGVTPEAATREQAFGPSCVPALELGFGPEEMEKTERRLSKAKDPEVSWVIVGCPHCSIAEIEECARLLNGKKLKDGVQFWVTTAVPIKALADRMGYTQIIEASGAKVTCDLCAIPPHTDERFVKRWSFRTVATNSAKMAHYMPGEGKLLCHYGNLERCVRAAISGRWE